MAASDEGILNNGILNESHRDKEFRNTGYIILNTFILRCMNVYEYFIVKTPMKLQVKYTLYTIMSSRSMTRARPFQSSPFWLIRSASTLRPLKYACTGSNGSGCGWRSHCQGLLFSQHENKNNYLNKNIISEKIKLLWLCEQGCFLLCTV